MTGECFIVRQFDPERFRDVIHVRRADPQIRVSKEFLDDVARGDRELAELDGDVLTIRGADRTVIYRIDWDDWDGTSYRAEWPD